MTAERTSGPSLGRRAFVAGALVTGVAACAGRPAPGPAPSPPPPPPPSPPPRRPPAIDLAADPAAVRTRVTVPVLCWHQLRDWHPDDSPYARSILVCPPTVFRDQLAAIAAAGYTTIGPETYLCHLTTAAPLPAKPVMLSFDDSQGSQITVGVPELTRRGMTATFFVMTVPLDKPGWMRRDDVRRLSGEGMTVAAHTYDHHRVDRYSGDDWRRQLVEPRAELERIVGAPVRHFAYPYGAWDTEDFAHLTAAGYWTAFQFGDDSVDATHPLLTLPRIPVRSTWSGPEILAALARPV